MVQLHSFDVQSQQKRLTDAVAAPRGVHRQIGAAIHRRTSLIVEFVKGLPWLSTSLVSWAEFTDKDIVNCCRLEKFAAADFWIRLLRLLFSYLPKKR
jgi:hypothetical protein